VSLRASTSQTIGPYLRIGLEWMVIEDLAPQGVAGQRVRIDGRVSDGDGKPVNDAAVEIWQANSHGKFNHPRDPRDLPLDPDFTGFGRSGTDDDGVYWFETIKPGPVPFEGEQLQAPHLSVTVHARGMLNHAQTRLYFEDEAANATDPILALVPAERRQTLIARREETDGAVTYRLDIVLQGRGETVFFNI
jgi:protocatechuate 3,4-dioxygenase, alpha subunit